jgi:hypothetical protein
MKSPNAVLVLAALAAGAALTGAALAAGKPVDKPSVARRAAVLQAIVDCRKMTDSDARLACYDAAAAKLDEAESTGQVVVVDREQARQVRRDIFGLQLPSLDIFNLGGGGKGAAATVAKGEEVDKLLATVKEARQLGDGKWTIELDTGAVWRQIENSDIALDIRPGQTVEIRKGAIGSFVMKVGGQPGFKAHRDR